MATVRSMLERNSQVVHAALQRRAAAAVEAAGLVRGLFEDASSRGSAIAAITGIVGREKTRDRVEFDTLHRACDEMGERNRVVSLICTLSEILVLCRRCSERVDVYRLESDPAGAREIAEGLSETAQQLRVAIGELGSTDAPIALSACKEARRRIDTAKAELDRTLAALFSDGRRPLEIVEWKDICEILEAALERWKNASEIVEVLAHGCV
jgi:hypothetical protein